ncbi:MAG: metal-sulfur cluster assembly factor [Nitrospirae bacterium]|nr:metal-sulfur cluster assembly factor [Nitrospirota bacterium]
MVTEEQVLDALRHVVDPELGLNVVDLGLIYGVQIEGSEVAVTMTLTTPGCPLHAAMPAGVEAAARSLPGVEAVRVEIVWDPPWSPERMSPDARERLG